MLGAIAGDIIASPYRRNNTEDMFFELCRSTRGEIHGRSVTFNPSLTEVSVMTAAVAHWVSRSADHDRSALVAELSSFRQKYPEINYNRGFINLLDRGGRHPLEWDWNGAAARVSPVGLFVDNLADVMSISAMSALSANDDTIRCVQAIAQAVWMASHGRSKEDICFAMEHDFSILQDVSDDELKLHLQGCTAEPIIVNGEDTGNVYYRPSGRMDISSLWSVTASLRAFIQSDNFESAVRRSVVLGGDSSAIAAICASIAAPFYGGVTTKIEKLCSRYVDSSLRLSFDDFEKRCSKAVLKTGKGAGVVDDTFSVIRVEGQMPTFVVASYRKELIQAIRDKFGPDVEIIKPSLMQKRLSALTPQPQSGTYIEDPRPEVRLLFFQDGMFRSGVTCQKTGAASLEDRMAAFQRFTRLKEFALGVKKDLQSRCGYTGDGDIHFETAFYPVVYQNRIEVREGDLLSGAIVFNPLTAEIHIAEDGDLREGEYQHADWCRERIFPSTLMSDDDIIQAIGRFCMDEGVGIGRERESNIDKANADMSRTRDVRLDSQNPESKNIQRSAGPKI